MPFMKNKNQLAIIFVVAALLSIPLIAMQFTAEVNWSVFDFVVAAGLLLGTGLTCELIWRTVTKQQHRVAICAAILMLLVLVWIELAVGIFNTPIGGS